MTGQHAPNAFVRTVAGDRAAIELGIVYAHEHLIIDSPLIASEFPHIHLNDVDAAVAEVSECRDAGVGLMLDAMPCASGRSIERLVTISERSGVLIVVATGLHHDRYYGPTHWSNRVGVDALRELFIADLVEGVDRFDYTSPIVERTPHRAGVIKVATSGETPDARDLRNLEAAAGASVATGAPILTHCEGGRGATAQVERLTALGVPASAVILSHVDKSRDLPYLRDVAQSGAVLEFDQSLRDHAEGADGFSVRSIATLIAEGFGAQLVVGTDGARRSLWRSLGGGPGLAWLARELPSLLTACGVSATDAERVLHTNAVRALSWRSADSVGQSART